MAYQSPFGNAPGLVPLATPSGTLHVPDWAAAAFPQPPPVVEPEPIAPPLIPAAPPGAGTVPGPSAQGAPEPLPPPPAPPDPFASALAGVDQTIGAVRERQRTDQPRDAHDMAMGYLADQRLLQQAGGEVEAAQGRAEAGTYQQLAEEDRAAEKARAVEREATKKEMDAARAELQTAQQAYTDHKVDQNRLWKNASTGQKIAAAIGVALSGLGGALVARDTGRPVQNPALDMIMGAMQDDVRLQLADRDKLGATIGMKRDAIGDLRQKYGDDEAAFQGIMASNLRRAETQIKAIAAQAKEPMAKLRLENLAAETGMRAAELTQSAEDRAMAAKQREIENRRAQSQLNLGWAGHNRDIIESDRAFNEGVRQFDAQMDYNAMKAEADAAAKRGEAAAAKVDKDRSLGIGDDRGTYLKQKDGTTFHAPTNEEGVRLRKLVTSGGEAARIIDGIKRLRAEHGAEWGNTEGGRQLKSDMAALQLVIKDNAELGVLAGPDMDIINAYVGTGDPTELDAFGSLEKGLDRVRMNIIGKTTAGLRRAGFTGDWAPPDKSKVGGEKSPEEKRLEKVLVSPKSKGMFNEDLIVAQTRGDDATVARIEGGYTAEQESIVNNVARAAATAQDPASRDLMLGQLDRIRKEAPSQAMRALAEEQYWEIRAGKWRPRAAVPLPTDNAFERTRRTLQEGRDPNAPRGIIERTAGEYLKR